MKVILFKLLRAVWLLSCLFCSVNVNAQNCWSGLGTGVGTDNSGEFVTSLVTYNGNIVAGGLIDTAGGIAASNIAMWNGSRWLPLGGGLPSGEVRCLAVYNNELFAGGYFDTLNGVAVNGIAKWNGSAWLPAGNGVGLTQHDVFTLAVYNGNLYAGGVFDSTASNDQCIAKWNGTVWSGLGGVAFSTVYALAVYGNRLYAGGEIQIAETSGIASWNDSTWAPVGGGVFGSGADPASVSALAVYDNGLYIAGGDIVAVGNPSVVVSDIARWDGTNWWDLNGGLTGDPISLQVFNGNLLAGGLITTASGFAAKGLVQWDGSTWSNFGGGVNGRLGAIVAMDTFNGVLYTAGSFVMAGSQNAINIASWNCATGFENIEADNLIKVYPNPSGGVVHFNLHNPNQKMHLEIYNLLGQFVFQSNLGPENTQVDLTGKAAGTYFYNIKNEDNMEIVNGKFVIQ